MKYSLYIFLSALLFTSCVKEEAGEGGRATISGKLKVHDYDAFGVYKGSYYAADERVYIIYGNDSIPSDDMRTGPNGDYRFEYLKRGTYSIFAYSDCDTCTSGSEAKYVSVQVTKIDEKVTAPELQIID